MWITPRRLRCSRSIACANSSTRFTPLPSLGQTRDGLTRERKGSMPRTRGGARGSRLRAGEAPRGGRQSAARRVAALRRDLRRTRDAIGLGSARVRRERRVRRASGRGPVRARLRRGGHHTVVAHARPRAGRRRHGRRHVAAGVRPPSQRCLRQEHRAGDRAVATRPRAPQDGGTSASRLARRSRAPPPTPGTRSASGGARTRRAARRGDSPWGHHHRLTGRETGRRSTRSRPSRRREAAARPTEVRCASRRIPRRSRLSVSHSSRAPA